MSVTHHVGTPLRQHMIDDMSVRNMASRTQQQYVYAVARFAQHFNKSPEHMGPDEIKTYQLYLIRVKKVAWSTLNILVCALRFLYNVTLDKHWAINHIIYPKRPKNLPMVLSPEEIAQFLDSISNIAHRAMLATAYAAGLRLSEVAALRVTDIDSKRMVIRVEHGKGDKTRYVMLSPELLILLREYWKAVRPAGRHWLFPGESPNNHISAGALGKACAHVWKASGLQKKVTLRTLRHCFGH